MLKRAGRRTRGNGSGRLAWILLSNRHSLYLVSSTHQRYRGITLVHVVEFNNESCRLLSGEVCSGELAAVVTHEKGVVAGGYFASVIDQVDGTPDFTVGSGVVLIGSVKVAEQPRPRAETTVGDQGPWSSHERPPSLPADGGARICRGRHITTRTIRLREAIRGARGCDRGKRSRRHDVGDGGRRHDSGDR